MKQFQYTITDANGIHARPAGLLVKEAQRFASAVKLIRGEKSADLKRLFWVMGLNVKAGDAVTVSAEGADEEAAIQALETFSSRTYNNPATNSDDGCRKAAIAT